jgi:outer membrane protein assembly factor BamE (lipoprotein component of BamABCDE complex)
VPGTSMDGGMQQRDRDASRMMGGRSGTPAVAARESARKCAPKVMAAAALALGLLLGGCFSETYQKGYIVPDGALEQIPVGSTQEQVLIVLGTPSTVATVSGEAFYYISQRAERMIGFMPQQVTDQRVVAVYFDKNRRVERLANYGMKDGKVFDFVSRTTPTGGKDVAYLNAIFKLSPF